MATAPTTRIRFLRPFTTRIFNPLSIHVAGWLPGFAILTHIGRKSGSTYRTPINVFRRGDHYVFALTTARMSSGSRTSSQPASARCGPGDAIFTWSSPN